MGEYCKINLGKQNTQRTQTMAKSHQLKKELSKTFPELKFSVKTCRMGKSKTGSLIIVTVASIVGSSYTMSEVKAVAKKYHNYKGYTDYVDPNNTVIQVENADYRSNLQEIKEMSGDDWKITAKIADNEYFSMLPDEYYEQKKVSQLKSPEIINKPVVDTALSDLVTASEAENKSNVIQLPVNAKPAITTVTTPEVKNKSNVIQLPVVTAEQIALVKPMFPDWFDGDKFLGDDDNDMACLIWSVAKKMRESGMPLYACYLVEKMAGDNWFSATYEEYVKLVEELNVE